MSIKSRVTRLEDQVSAGSRPSAEALRVADDAIARGLLAPEDRDTFALSWRGFEAALEGLEAACETDR